ncbi:YceI family protein [Alsobacter sp. R-9]
MATSEPVSGTRHQSEVASHDLRRRRGIIIGCCAAALVALGLTPGPSADAATRAAWKVDPDRTRILFAIDAVGWPRTQGVFRAFDGRIALDFDRPAQSRVTFRVAAASVDTGSGLLDDFIRGSAFLNTSRHPDVRFASTGVEKLDGRTVRVTGDFTLLGVTRPGTMTVEVEPRTAARERVGFVARGSIKRSDFGMTAGLPLIDDVVQLTVTTEAVAE